MLTRNLMRSLPCFPQLRKVSEQDLHEIEAKVRKVSNEEVAFLVTNPFKRVTAFKSGAKDEWAQMNDMVVKVRV